MRILFKDKGGALAATIIDFAYADPENPKTIKARFDKAAHDQIYTA